MSRSSFGFRRSFNSGRKLSRENRKDIHSSEKGQSRSEHNDMHEKRQRSRHDNRDTDKATRSIFGDVPLTDTERRYLWAAQSGNLPALELLIEESGTFNLSCRDYLGRTALQLAVLGEHYDCIQLLLDRCKLEVIEEGLLHAIKTENVKICDMFLAHPVYSDQRSRMQLEFQHGFYEQEDSSSSFAPDITPIVLAAQCNNFDIVHMLIQKGFTIPTPHNYFCLCTECCNHKNFDRVVHSKSRLNAYRGLASTAYLALSCDDPIYAAFELSRSLQKLAEREKEHKSEYRGLSDKCKNFAVDLLDQCRTNEEVMAALHGGTDTRDLSRIKMAIRYEQKKFIAHASCQEHLASMWYAGASWFQHQNFPIKLILVPLGIVFIPVTAIVYVFLPYSTIGKILKSPFMKFMNYICSYTAFLVLLFLGTQLSSFKSVHLFNGIEGVVNTLIMFYVLGMFWAECKQLWEEGVKNYFSQMWNYMDITMLALYTAGYSTEGVIYTKTRGFYMDNHLIHSEDESVLNPQILSKVLFSVANVMSFARIAYILPASETFGQLQISYGRMLQDVGKFIFIYFTVMIAFICGLTSLYSISKNKHFAGLLETTGTLFWAAFGMGNSQAPAIKEEEVDNSSINLDTGSEVTDSELLKVIEMVGYILYGVYILGAVVVLINMLIAMMSNTFEDIQKSEDCEWKFARAKLWISFIEQGTTLPIPFNIIPTPKSVLRLFHWMRDSVCCQMPRNEANKEDSKQYDMEYKAIMHRVVLRYIHKMKFEKKGESLKDDILDSREEVIYQIHSMYGRLVARLELLEKDVFLLTKHGWDITGSLSHSSLSYSRSVPSHPGGEGHHVTSEGTKDPFHHRRRSYYHDRPKRQSNIGGSRLSLEERLRKYSETDPQYFRSSLVNLSTQSSTNMSDGDKRSRACSSQLSPAPSVHDIHPCSSAVGSVSPGYLNQMPSESRKESMISNASQNVSELEDFGLVRRNSFRQWPHGNDGNHVSRADVDRRSRDDTMRGSRKGYNSSPRWNQGVIKESSLEDQINTSVEQETALTSEVYAPATSRREMFSYPNIDAPFGPPNSDVNKANNFQEHLVTKRTRKDTIENLVLDVHQVPFAKLDISSPTNPTLTHPNQAEDPTNSDARKSLSHSSSPRSADSTVASKTFSFPACINSKAPSCDAVGAKVVGVKRSDVTSGQDSDNEAQYAAKLSTVSLQHICPRYSAHVSGKVSNSTAQTSAGVSQGHQDNAKPHQKVIRKLGHVNHVYLPDSLVPRPDFDPSLSEQCSHNPDSRKKITNCTESQIFYTKVPLETKCLLGDESIGQNSQDLTDLTPEADVRTNPFHSSKPESFTGESFRVTDQMSGPPTKGRPYLTDQTVERTEGEACLDQVDDLTRATPEPSVKSTPNLGASKHHRLVNSAREPRARAPLFTAGYQDYYTVPWYSHYPLNMESEQLSSPDGPDLSPMVIPSLATNLQPFPLPCPPQDMFSLPVSDSAPGREVPQKKPCSAKKASLVSLVRGRRSDKVKGKMTEVKHNRSLSLNRSVAGSRRDRLKTLQTQRSKEV